MAVRYAVATGNWSNTAIWNGGTLPTSADDVYANGFTVTINQNVTVLTLQNVAQSPAVAGGGFLLTGSFTINATAAAGLTAGATTLLTYTGINSVINAIINGSANTNVNTINFNSPATLTINGNVLNVANTAVDVITTNSTGTLNVTGTINKTGRGNNIVVASVCTVNIVGDIISNTAFSGGATIAVNSNATVNITGNLTSLSNANGPYTLNINSVNCIVNITGNVDYNAANVSPNHTINFANTGKLFITGNVTRTAIHSNSFTINSGVGGYLNIIGMISAGFAGNAVISSSPTAINIFSGPFVCSAYGFMPFLVTRMHYQKTFGSYIEFRDSSTNGAISPGPVAPATRLVSPDTVVDAPIPTNVRFGTSYALGTFTGTLRVPTPASVSKDVPTDNTVGTAILSAADIFNTLVSTMNVSGSIGERLKNVSTVQTNGEQLASLN